MDSATLLKLSIESLIAQNVTKRKTLKEKSKLAWKSLQRGEIAGERNALREVNGKLKSILRQATRPRSSAS